MTSAAGVCTVAVDGVDTAGVAKCAATPAENTMTPAAIAADGRQIIARDRGDVARLAANSMAGGPSRSRELNRFDALSSLGFPWWAA